MNLIKSKLLIGTCALSLLLLSCDKSDNTNKSTSSSVADGTTSVNVENGIKTSSTNIVNSYSAFIKSEEFTNLNSVLGLGLLTALKSKDSNLKYSLNHNFDGLKSNYLYSQESFTTTYGTYRLLSKSEVEEYLQNNNNMYPSLFVLIKDSAETRADLGSDGWVIYLPKDFISKNNLQSIADKINDVNILNYVLTLTSASSDNNKLLKTVIKKDVSLQNLNVNEIEIKPTSPISVLNYTLILEDTVTKTSTNLVEVTHTIGIETISDIKVKTLEEKIVIGDYSIVKNTGITLGAIVNSNEDAGGESEDDGDGDDDDIDYTAPKLANKFSLTFKNKDAVLFSTNIEYAITYKNDTLKSYENIVITLGNYKLVGVQTLSFVELKFNKSFIPKFNLYESTSSGDVLVGKLNFDNITDLKDYRSATITTTNNEIKTLSELIDFSTIGNILTGYDVLSTTLKKANSLYVKLIKTSIHKDEVYKKEYKGKVRGRKY